MKKLAVVFALTAVGCTAKPAESPASDQAQPTQQQVIVDRATAAVKRLRSQARFAVMDKLLAKAKAVLIFPKLIKASLIVGGEGGNGVMLVRGDDGSWSSPAFYSLGAPSVGLQAGFRESTAVLFVMNELTMETLLHSSMTLGAQTSATLGHVGERGLTEGEMIRKDIYVLTESGGAFAGVSLDGYVIATRKAHNELYYGQGASARSILTRREHNSSAAAELQKALWAQPAPAEGDAPAPNAEEPSSPPPPAPAATTAPEAPASAPAAAQLPAGYRECSPESRQVATCKDEQASVCAGGSEQGTLAAWRTFPNACEACRDAAVTGYAVGACQSSAP